MKKIAQKKSGFTLLELTLAIAIVAIISVMMANVLNIFSRAAAQGATLYSAQTDVRRSISVASDRLRNAASIYLLPDKFFNETRNQNLPLEYNFFGVEKTSDGKTQLINYVLNESGTGHNRIIIAESTADVSYKIVLDKSESETASGNLIGVKIICSGPGIATQEITTSFRAINAGYVSDWSSGTDGIAIAYAAAKSDLEVTRTPAVKGGAAIYMVLDNSGSMAESINDGALGSVDESRAYHLRIAGNTFVEKLAAYDHVYLGIQGFDTSAPASARKSLVSLSDPSSIAFFSDLFNAPYYLSHSTEFSSTEARDSKILYVNGGTNVGDGLRMAYYSMLADVQALGISDYKKYMTFISDGDPTAYTVPYNAPDAGDPSSYYYYGTLETSRVAYRSFNASKYVPVNGLKSAYAEDYKSTNYAKGVAKMIANSGEFEDFFLVAMGDLKLEILQQIANSFGIDSADFPTHVFKAKDQMNFYMAIESIAESISVDVEALLGASLLEGVKDDHILTPPAP
jgi:prepilin-type N-terminal cleavage/methylation domain-containing protein